MFISVCARQYNKVFELAERVKQDPMSLRFRTPTLYLLLLLLISALGDASHAMLALKLYEEMCGDAGLKCSDEQHDRAVQLVFTVLEKSSDFTLLLPLKAVYESITVLHLGSRFETQYIGVCMSILLNSLQYNKALDLLDKYLATLEGSEYTGEALASLPLARLFEYMCSVQDCNNLSKWLGVVGEASRSDIISASDWSKYLGLALSLNHYKLVKLIYEQWIMAGMDTRLAIEDVVVTNIVTQIESLSPAFRSLSETTLYQILHTFALHGDVELTLNLIEWHYIHKSLKGEKALSKELCVDIIHSYCFFEESSIGQGEHDRSMERVLDVINSFTSRENPGFELSYKDISDAVSHKIHTYKASDQNVAKARMKAKGTHHFIEKMNEEGTNTEPGQLPRKTTNKNLSESSLGNPLLNTDVLHDFVEGHIRFLLDSSSSRRTIDIFISCILNHINKFQNFSGMIVVLQTLKLVNADFFTEWLSRDLVDIIIKSISNSPAARFTGLELYKQMRVHNIILTHANMVHLILSSMHTPRFHLLFEYYVYEYLNSSPTLISMHLIRRIEKFSHLDDRGRVVLNFLKEHQKLGPTREEVEQFWVANDLNKDPLVGVDAADASQYDRIDIRDCQQLKDILVSNS